MGEGGEAHKEKISIAQVRVFGQKVRAEISGSRLRSEGEQKRISAGGHGSYGCQARMFKLLLKRCLHSLQEVEANRALKDKTE